MQLWLPKNDYRPQDIWVFPHEIEAGIEYTVYVGASPDWELEKTYADLDDAIAYALCKYPMPEDKSYRLAEGLLQHLQLNKNQPKPPLRFCSLKDSVNYALNRLSGVRSLELHELVRELLNHSQVGVANWRIYSSDSEYELNQRMSQQTFHELVQKLEQTPDINLMARGDNYYDFNHTKLDVAINVQFILDAEYMSVHSSKIVEDLADEVNQELTYRFGEEL